MSTPPVTNIHVEMAQRWLARLTSGAMTGDEMQRLRDWLAIDVRHRSAFERERAAWRQLGPLRERLAASLSASALAPAGRKSLARWRAGFATRGVIATGLAACLAACLVLCAVLGNPLVWMRADYATGVGEVARVTLPDGSTAILDTDSALATRFERGERRIELLRGRAWFDVQRDASRPFRVHADEGVAEATGTAFSVERHDDSVIVRVTEGSVAVTSGRTLHLSAETQATLSGDPATITAAPFDENEQLGWRSRRIVIEKMPLGQALAELDRYRPGRILLLNADPAAVHVSGTFTLDTLDDGLEALASSQGLRVVHLTPYLVVLHR